MGSWDSHHPELREPVLGLRTERYGVIVRILIPTFDIEWADGDSDITDTYEASWNGQYWEVPFS